MIMSSIASLMLPIDDSPCILTTTTMATM